MKSTEMKPASTNDVKKNYQNPRLMTYGAIREITQAVGPNGMMDGSLVSGMMMTSL